MADESKKLSELTQQKPVQLTLFELSLPKEQKYSNTLELYDFMPKYVWGRPKRINKTFLNSIEREFEYRNNIFKIRIKPASLENKQGQEVYYFPNKREQLVEEALRKLIVSGKGTFLDGDVGIIFSLYQLQNELKRNQHTYSTDELKDSIRILNDTKITITGEDGQETAFHPIESYGFAGENGEEKTWVKFTPWVTNTIKSGKFRLYNYDIVMSYKTIIARQLHKRFSHHHVTSSMTRPFNIKLSTIIRDFGLTRYEKIQHNVREVIKALEEMKDKKVIIYYKREDIFDTEKKNKLVDVKFYLTGDFKLNDEIILANTQQKKFREKIP